VGMSLTTVQTDMDVSVVLTAVECYARALVVRCVPHA